MPETLASDCGDYGAGSGLRKFRLSCVTDSECLIGGPSGTKNNGIEFSTEYSYSLEVVLHVGNLNNSHEQ